LRSRRKPAAYVHDAQENTLTLETVERLMTLTVQVQGRNEQPLLDVQHHDLLQLDFVSTHKKTGKQVNFTLIVGTKGSLRGVPVQIRCQPNWWFQVVLNLRPEKFLAPPPHAPPARVVLEPCRGAWSTLGVCSGSLSSPRE